MDGRAILRVVTLMVFSIGTTGIAADEKPGGSVSFDQPSQTVSVTSTADSGPGSLRDALAKGDRRVIFRVGGTIDLRSTLVLRASTVVVDGSTGPEPGITIVGKPFVIQDARDVLINHLRFRNRNAPRKFTLREISDR